MGRGATLRSARGQRQRRGPTKPTTGEPATHWDNRPPQPEPTAENLFSMWRRHRPKLEPVSVGVRAKRKAAQREKRLAARARARANGKRTGRD